ncbi:PepSY domain-containing protein [Pseudoduganella sp. DS3]|uniref:PepSY domain-containing protein n=1 Tax=Pseudoduganella guangdongensis TaxID=2692179 RepID=A0A6N9HFZ1_9BURK|nr:PepSY-associated TM helix domain-containing protein [Pseudoduganella guangdongensis]MYN02309.1 PepSY domain-containing protein [Pseudoduganella guangdongensis]
MKIRSDILRVYQSLHTWTGICAGILLFIGFFGGALTMFKQPLERWVSPPSAPIAALAPQQMDRVVAQVLAQHPAARQEFTLHVQRDEANPAPVTWSAGEGGRELQLDAMRWQATLDADGSVQAQQVRPSLFGELVDMLHRTGGIPGHLGDEYVGVYLMGVAGVLYFLALVSGLILLLPTLVKDFFALRQGKNRKRFWLDAHNVVGIASLPFHIVISLTVIVFAFHDQFYDALQQVVYGERKMWVRPAGAPGPGDATRLMPASELVKRVQQQAPGFAVTELLYMDVEGKRPLVRAGVAHQGYVVRGAVSGYVLLEPYTGQVLNTSMLPTKSDTWSRIVAPFFSLHFGSYGGDWMRWVYFVFGLAGAFLFYSGNLLWVEKRRKNQLRGQEALPLQPRRTLLLAAATVGICLGSVAGVAGALLAAKWLHGAVANLNATLMTAYYSVFLACVGWAFWRGAARAGVELLALCALLGLAVPATSLLALAFPSLGMWAHGSLGVLAVDATALVLALLLTWGARLAYRRARSGPGDSVWSHAAGGAAGMAAAAGQPAPAVPSVAPPAAAAVAGDAPR